MASGTTSPWPLTKQADKQHPVQTLQYLLRARGASLSADGDFGPLTNTAVRAFQQQKGLAADGTEVEGVSPYSSPFSFLSLVLSFFVR